jgi:chromosomal replication initiation ATPase DnaA
MITEFSRKVAIPELELLDKIKRKQINDARELYWYILLSNGFCITEIARLNDRGHATIISGIRRIKGLLEAKDKEITRMYNLTKNIKR